MRMRIQGLFLIGLFLGATGPARMLFAQTDWISDLPTSQQFLGSAAEGLVCSPNGAYIGVATARGLILKKGDQTILDQPVGHLYGLDLSPDGRFLAAGGRDGTIRVWDLDSREMIKTLQGHRGTVSSVRFSPDGRRMLSGNWDGSVVLWSTDTWTQLRSLPGHTDEVYGVAFSPNGTLLASGGWDQTIRIWKGETVETLRASAGVMAVAFSPDGKYLAAGAYDGTVGTWSAEGAWSPVAQSRDVRSPVWALTFSPDGRYLVSGHEDGGLRVLSVPEGRTVKIVPHRGAAATGLWLDSPNSRLISVSRSGELAFWRTSITDVVALSVDVDENIPRGKAQDPDAIAVVLGVVQYRNIDRATYAKRDAAVFKEYAVNVLGVPDDRNHLYFKTDEEVTKGEFEKLFTAGGWLERRAQPTSDVYVFYSGHGAPEISKRSPYLIPSDGDANYPTQTGFGLDRLYEELGKLPVRSVTVFLDACFSGGTREKKMLLAIAKPAYLEVENPALLSEKMVAFAASSGDQISSGYPDKRHGLFTYFLLKGLRGDADRDNDRAITVEELEAYLVANVKRTAGQLDREQTPQVMGRDKARVLVRF